MANRSPSRVAVTGASGFIGRRFLELYAERFAPVGLVRTFPVSPVPGVEYRAADIGLPHAVRFGVRDCDSVVHFAYDHRNRAHAVAATDHVLAACRAAGVQRLVHISSVAVYDQTVDGRLDEDTGAARWRDPYIESKLRIERLLRRAWRGGYRNVVILQPTIVYGWGGGWTEHALRACRAGAVELPLAGAAICNAVYVDDVCQAALAALTCPADADRPSPPRYVINGPDEVSWADFFRAHGDALAAAGVPAPSARGGDPGSPPAALEISAPATTRRFHDDAKVNLAMTLAFRPAASRALFTALGLRGARGAADFRDPAAVLAEEPAPKPLRFNGMGRLYTATRCRADSARAAAELGYAPRFDLAAGTTKLADALGARVPRVAATRPRGALIDLDKECPSAPLRRRVCIIGTGLGGGALACNLLHRGDDVVIVEAGNERAMSDDDAHVGLETTGLEFGLAIFRDISVGGSGNAWRGLCAPRDHIDFEHRDWVPYSGWPITPDDLAAASHAAAALLHVDDPGLFDDQSTLDGAREHTRDIDFSHDEFGLKYFLQTRPPRSFRDDLLAATRAPGGPLLLEDAPALELLTDSTGKRVEALLVKDAAGRAHKVEADVFVVCAGALETPRLLLNSRNGCPDGIGNEHGLVGRFLMDHPMVAMGQVRLHHARTAPLFQGLHLAPGRMIKAGVVMHEEAQRRHRLPNHSVFLLPSLHRGFDDRYERARRSLITARRKRLSARDIAVVATNPNVIQWALSYVTPLPALFRYADLFVIAEQLPNADSRVELAEQRDRYGYRMARAHWALTDDDVDSIARFSALLLQAFAAPEYSVTYRRARDQILEGTTSAAHFCGTARMAATPESGVVDPDLKVWGVDNLYACDASVMPTAGNANPGLTIVALAQRLAEHLSARRPAGR